MRNEVKLQEKQNELEQQLKSLKESKIIDGVSQSETQIKNVVESFLHFPIEVNPGPSTLPVTSSTTRSTKVENLIEEGKNKNFSINSLPHVYQIIKHPENPDIPGLHIEEYKLQHDWEEMLKDSEDNLKDGEVEVQNRLMFIDGKDNNNLPIGQSVIDHGSILSQIGSNLSHAAESENQQNPNANISNLVNQAVESPINQKNPNTQFSNILESIQMSQNVEKKDTNMNNSRSLPNNLNGVVSKTPFNMRYNNGPIIGSGKAGPFNTAQETFSQMESFMPRTDNEENVSDQESMKENDKTNQHGFHHQNPVTISNDGSNLENIPVTEQVSTSKEQNLTNDSESATLQSAASLDNHSKSTENYYETLIYNGTDSSLPGGNSNPLLSNLSKEEMLNGSPSGSNLPKVENQKTEFALPKGDLDLNIKNDQGDQDVKLKLKAFTDQVMQTLKHFQEEINSQKDNYNNRTEIKSETFNSSLV